MSFTLIPSMIQDGTILVRIFLCPTLSARPHWLIFVKYCLHIRHLPPVAIFIAHFLQVSKHLQGTGLYSASSILQKKHETSQGVPLAALLCWASPLIKDKLLNILSLYFELMGTKSTDRIKVWECGGITYNALRWITMGWIWDGIAARSPTLKKFESTNDISDYLRRLQTTDCQLWTPKSGSRILTTDSSSIYFLILSFTSLNL